MFWKSSRKEDNAFLLKYESEFDHQLLQERLIIFEDGFDNAKEIIFNYYNSVLDWWNT